MTTETKSTRELMDRYHGFSNRQESARFRQVVDMLIAYMMDGKIAPDEIRDAAFVASIRFAQINPAPRIVYERDDLWPNDGMRTDP